MRGLVMQMLASGVMLALCGCGRGEPHFVESNCVLVGSWQAHEERVGGDCDPDEIPASLVLFDISEVDMTEEEEFDMAEQKTLWRFDLERGGVTLESCSGVHSEDRCSLEMTCGRSLDESRIDYAFTLELSEAGALSGANVLTVSPDDGDPCEARFTLAGERISVEGARKHTPRTVTQR